MIDKLEGRGRNIVWEVDTEAEARDVTHELEDSMTHFRFAYRPDRRVEVKKMTHPTGIVGTSYRLIHLQSQPVRYVSAALNRDIVVTRTHWVRLSSGRIRGSTEVNFTALLTNWNPNGGTGMHVDLERSSLDHFTTETYGPWTRELEFLTRIHNATNPSLVNGFNYGNANEATLSFELYTEWDLEYETRALRICPTHAETIRIVRALAQTQFDTVKELLSCDHNAWQKFAAQAALDEEDAAALDRVATEVLMYRSRRLVEDVGMLRTRDG